MNTTFAQRLFELRQEHGYSQEELAEALGVSRQAISNWERGATSPDTNNLVALARLYKVSVDELLGLGLEPSAPSSAPNEPASEELDDSALAAQESAEESHGAAAAGAALRFLVAGFLVNGFHVGLGALFNGEAGATMGLFGRFLSCEGGII